MKREPLFAPLPHPTNVQSLDVGDLLAEIRGLLYMPPSTDVWMAIWACLAEVPEDLLCGTYIPYVQEHLAIWPDGLRLAPKKLKPLYYDETKTPSPREEALLGLVDTLAISPHQTFESHHLARFAENPLSNSLTSFHLYYHTVNEASWAALIRSTALSQLRNLTFNFVRMDSKRYQLLGDSPWFPQLQTLTLIDCVFPDASFTCGVQLPHLHTLSLRGSSIDALLQDAFGEAPPQLTHLHIRDTAPPATLLRAITTGCHETLQDISARGLAYEEHDLLTALGEGGPYPQLTSLRLDHLRQTEAELHTLLCGEHLPALESLELSRLALGETLVDLLEQATSLTQLKSLKILYNELGPKGLARLARLPHLASLETLTLQGIAPTAESLEALFHEATFAQLKRLNLSNNDIGKKRGSVFVEPHQLRHLEHLDVGYNALGDDLVLGIVANPATPSLFSLGCHGTSMSLAGIYALLNTTSVAQGLRQGVLDKLLSQCTRDGLTTLLRLFKVPQLHKMNKPALLAAAKTHLITTAALERFLCHEVHIKQLSQQGMKATLRSLGEKGYGKLRAQELRDRVKAALADKDRLRDAVDKAAEALQSRESET